MTVRTSPIKLLPHDNATEEVTIFRDHLKISQWAYHKLRAEREMLGKAVASLNRVRRKETSNANIVEIEE